MKKLSSPPRLFTTGAANKTLPLVAVIVADLAPLWQSVCGTRRRIKHLVEGREIDTGNPYSDELQAIQERLACDSQKVEGFIDELREIGVEFKGARRLCHACFPAMLDGRLVYLSWRLGEQEVSHWVDIDGKFEDRQSLFAAPSAAE